MTSRIKPFVKFKTLQSYANHLARVFFNTTANAQVIQAEPGTEPKPGHYVRPGHRKYTTGEYVAKKYLSNFGWKNTYYCPAEVSVHIPGDIIVYFKLKEESNGIPY